MSEEKPVRIEGDPEGYEPVFDNGDICDCFGCALKYTPMCDEARCAAFDRPEKHGVKFFHKESSK